MNILDYEHHDEAWVSSATLVEKLQDSLKTAEGWQRFEAQQQGHLLLTNIAFSQDIPTDARPYKGLHYFDNVVEDALYFKGRDALIDELISKVKNNAFLAILGASGNGKSSVIRAGVLYQLQQDTQWHILKPITPTDNPLEIIKNSWKWETDNLLDFIQTSPQERIILTIDQFEEVFTLCQNEQIRTTFFDLLLEIVEQANDKVCLIVIMRADFLAQCSHYPQLANYFQNHQHIITRPTGSEIRQMIEEPAKKAGLSVEPRLVAEIEKDFKDSIGNLPLLEFALTTLWEKGKTDRLLRYDDYQALGGISRILDQKATDVFNSLSDGNQSLSQEQIIAKRIFLELTSLGEGEADTRRQVQKQQLLQLSSYSPVLIDKVIDILAKSYLLVVDESIDAESQEKSIIINIAHEALIEHWSLLREWLVQSREDIKLQREIDNGAIAWKADKKALLVGVDLSIAERYLESHLDKMPLSEGGIEFIKASVTAREKALQEQEKQRQERERLQLRNLQILAISLVIAIVLGVLGWWQWGEAEYQRNRAQKEEQIAIEQKIIAQSERDNAELQASALLSENLFSSGNEFDALLEGIKAGHKLKKIIQEKGNIQPSTKNRILMTLHQVINNITEKNQLIGHTAKITDIAYSPDNKLIVTTSEDKTVKIWRHDGKLLKTIDHENTIEDICFSPNGELFAYVDSRNVIRVLDKTLNSQKIFGPKINLLNPDDINIPFHDGGLNFTPNGEKIALWFIPKKQRNNFTTIVHDNFRVMRLYHLKDGGYKDVAIKGASTGEPIEFSPNGKLFITLSFYWSTDYSPTEKPALEIWNTNGILVKRFTEDEIPFLSTGQNGSLNSVRFSPDGQRIIVTKSNAISMFDLDGKLVRTFLTEEDIENKGVDKYSQNKNNIIYDRDGKLNQVSREKLLLDSTSDDLFGTSYLKIDIVAFSNTTNLVAIASNEENKKLIRIWNKSGDLLKLLKGHVDDISALSFSKDNQRLVSGDISGNIKIWDISGSTNLFKQFREHNNAVKSVSFSADGNTFVSLDLDNLLVEWDKYGSVIKKWNISDEEIEGGMMGKRRPKVVFNPINNQMFALIAKENHFQSGTIKLFQSGGLLLNELKQPTHEPEFSQDEINTLNFTKGISFSSDGKTIASCGVGLKIWDYLGNLLSLGPQSCSDVAFSPNGKKIAITSYLLPESNISVYEYKEFDMDNYFADNVQKGKIRFYANVLDVDNQLLFQKTSCLTDCLENNSDDCLSTNNFIKEEYKTELDRIYCEMQELSMKGLVNHDISDLKSQKKQLHKYGIYELVFSNNGQFIVSAGQDNTVKIWDGNTGTLLKTLVGHTGEVSDIDVSPDSKTILSVSIDGIRLWDLSGKELTFFGQELSKQNRYIIGIGVELDANFSVKNVSNNRAAHKAGVQVGDKIVAINNTPTDKLNLAQVIDLLGGQEGSEVKIKLLRKEHDFFEKLIQRGKN